MDRALQVVLVVLGLLASPYLEHPVILQLQLVQGAQSYLRPNINIFICSSFNEMALTESYICCCAVPLYLLLPEVLVVLSSLLAQEYQEILCDLSLRENQ